MSSWRTTSTEMMSKVWYTPFPLLSDGTYPFLFNVLPRRHMKKIRDISRVFDERPATDFVARTLIVRSRNPQSCTSDAQVKIDEKDRLGPGRFRLRRTIERQDVQEEVNAVSDRRHQN